MKVNDNVVKNVAMDHIYRYTLIEARLTNGTGHERVESRNDISVHLMNKYCERSQPTSDLYKPCDLFKYDCFIRDFSDTHFIVSLPLQCELVTI